MKEYENAQKMIADCLIEKETLEKIRNKLNQNKKKAINKNIKEEKEETSINKKISESRISSIEQLLISEKNKDKINEYITRLEEALEEKENLIRDLFFQEYINQENYEVYQQKIDEQFSQISNYNNKIYDLEKDKKKSIQKKMALVK